MDGGDRAPKAGALGDAGAMKRHTEVWLKANKLLSGKVLNV
jgi:hypothetical protein